MVGGVAILIACIYGTPALLRLWGFSDKRSAANRRYDDNKERKGFQVVIDQQESQIQEQQRWRTAMEAKLEVKDAEILQAKLAHEGMRVKNEGLQADVLREREARENLAIEFGKLQKEIEALWRHDAVQTTNTAKLEEAIKEKLGKEKP